MTVLPTRVSALTSSRHPILPEYLNPPPQNRQHQPQRSGVEVASILLYPLQCRSWCQQATTRDRVDSLHPQQQAADILQPVCGFSCVRAVAAFPKTTAGSNSSLSTRLVEVSGVWLNSTSPPRGANRKADVASAPASMDNCTILEKKKKKKWSN